MIVFQCPRGHRSRFIELKPVYRYELRSFLWLRWIARISDGHLVRCIHHGCGRVWDVGPDGVQEPAQVAPPMPEPSGNGDEDRPEREPVPALGGAIRRLRP